MSDMTPVNPEAPKQTAAETYAELEKAHKAGTLAQNREYSTEAMAPAEAVVKSSFKELADEDILKLTKQEMLEYLKASQVHSALVKDAEVAAEGEASKRAAIHGMVRRPIGEDLPGDGGYKRGIPKQLLDKEGEPRVSKEGTPVTRTDW